MRGELTIIRADGTTESVPYSKKVPLEHLQRFVGGYIEAVPYFGDYQGKPCVALCDEEGKLKGKPYNEKATTIWKASAPRLDDYLAGDIVIVTGDLEFMRNL